MAVDQPMPLVVDIKRNSLDDGPGIRSVVFFKGCPLDCAWCHNPETKDPGREIAFNPKECIGCGRCGEACPNGAIMYAGPDRIDRKLCKVCGKCADACPGLGLRIMGNFIPVDNLVEYLLLDEPFYRNSGGGVTLSGGEPTMFMEYAGELSRALKKRGVHVTLETCGHFNMEKFKKILLPYIDIIYYDIKLSDGGRHEEYTGRGNEIIRNNIRELVAENVELLVRVPLVPGITAVPENLAGIKELLTGMGLGRLCLLTYNPLWAEKICHLGKKPGYHYDRWMTEGEKRAAGDCFKGLQLVQGL